MQWWWTQWKAWQSHTRTVRQPNFSLITYPHHVSFPSLYIPHHLLPFIQPSMLPLNLAPHSLQSTTKPISPSLPHKKKKLKNSTPLGICKSPSSAYWQIAIYSQKKRVKRKTNLSTSQLPNLFNILTYLNFVNQISKPSKKFWGFRITQLNKKEPFYLYHHILVLLFPFLVIICQQAIV